MAKNTQIAQSNDNYTAVIREASRDLSPKERVMFKDMANATSLVDFASAQREIGEKAIIDVADFAVIDVHNPKATDNVDYTIFLIIDKNGNKFYTSSEAFWSAFSNIYAEMKGSDEEWGIEAVLIPSKNYKGKEILTCSLV